jgi:hypothetical protein
MSWSSPHSILGALVLAAGIVALGSAVSGQQDQADPETSPPVTEVIQMELPPPVVEGVDSAIQRVLYASGKAEAFSPNQVSDIPVSVARVLAYYDVTLMVPTVEGGSGQ